MEEMQQHRPVNPRRRKKSKLQIFKEAYLPAIIAGLALVMILVFIIGSAVRSAQNKQAEKQAQIAAAQQQEQEMLILEQEAEGLHQQAQTAAAGFDYDLAISLLDSFSGDATKFPKLMELRDQCVLAKSQLIAWEDPSQVLNLSLQMLIADPQRAFEDDLYATSFKNNFLTTEEFSEILEQLYRNGYILVSLSDIYTTSIAEDGTEIFSPKTLYLPNGKRPLILTQTNVNYHTYLTDSNDDKLPDSGGCGFASKLIYGAGGSFSNEYITADGSTVTGAYDMIPILEQFISAHPDFSYQGARAVIALTGYDGLFGYRTNSEAKETFGEDLYNQNIADARLVGKALVEYGYELACYTYENRAYGGYSTTQIEADLSGWITEVTAILPDVDIFVFAKNSDIAEENTFYEDERFHVLSNAGFRYFLGFSTTGQTWSVLSDTYVRQGRILLTPTNLRQHPDWFGNIFDADSILNPARTATGK